MHGVKKLDLWRVRPPPQYCIKNEWLKLQKSQLRQVFWNAGSIWYPLVLKIFHLSYDTGA
jgi:hypothetical protein